MKRILSLLLVICLLISCSFTLLSCGEDTTPQTPSNPPSNDNPTEQKPEDSAAIIVPTYKDYGRETVNFTDIEYKRPDIASVINDFASVSNIISKNEISKEEQLSKILSLEDAYKNLTSMYAITQIKNSKNSADSYWNAEFLYISTNFPSFSRAVEDLFVAAAKSEHRNYFEENYFHSSLKEYEDGGKYTDALISLLAREAELEAEYSSLSTATVVITYNGKTDTVDALLLEAELAYGKNSTEYLQALTMCKNIYSAEVSKLSRPIYVELVKTRHLIADELGYESYVDVAYSNLSHEYSKEDMLKFLEDIKIYVIPVYSELWFKAFEGFLRENAIDKVDRVTVINTLYELYKDTDSDLCEIYSYMLQHGLYDISQEADNRMNGAFTTYIESNASPFIFMTLSGYTSDYLTLAHEFGHFVDGYVNNGSDASLDLSEVSSQALEYLTLLSLKNELSEASYKYLEYDYLTRAMESLINQGIIAAFEHKVYNIPLDQITEQAIDNAATEALRMFTESDEDTIKFDAMLMTHTVEYPMYVQSYCTSMTASLEIFFLENENKGAGLATYKALIARGDADKTYEELLIGAGLSVPFSNNLLRDISDKIHYYVLGSHYFNMLPSDNENAA